MTPGDTKASAVVNLQVAETSGRSIFDLVIKHEEFFAQDLPNLKEFVKACDEPLRLILLHRWSSLLPAAASPLVVNILINPNLFFCHRDATRGQYSRYFRPIYLDDKALAASRQSESAADAAATAIVKLHDDFDAHYDNHDLDAREFLSLNDIEALRERDAPRSAIGPLPPAGSVVTIAATDRGVSIWKDATDYTEEIGKTLSLDPKWKANTKFDLYLRKVTSHGGSYHQVTVGNDRNWVGRVYLAFRSKETTLQAEWLAGLREFAFEILAPMTLAGTFVRNREIVEMIGDVRELLVHARDTRQRHSVTLERFRASGARARRELLPTIKDVNQEHSPALFRVAVNRFPTYSAHLAGCSCVNCKEVVHALKDCQSGGGTAFLTDITELLKRIDGFEGSDDVRRYMAHAFTFGITESERKPEELETYFTWIGIPLSWIEKVKTRTFGAAGVGNLTSDKVEPLVLPYLRAVLLMLGNSRMVADDVKAMGLALNGDPELQGLTSPHPGRICATVSYGVSGELKASDENRLDRNVINNAAHVHQNRVVAGFAERFLDDFQMRITTRTSNYSRQTTCLWTDQRWSPTADTGTVTFHLAFSSH